MEKKMYSPRQKILWFALSTRIFIVFLQAVSNVLIPDHDAKVFLSPTDPHLAASIADRAVDIVLGGFKRWDAVYFVHIAHYGYTYENCLAFYPLFPLITRYLAYALYQVVGSILNMNSLILLAALLVNLFCFVKSTDALHTLSRKVLRSESRAYISTVLYCINPASIFFTAPYSESFFAWLSFYAMYQCTQDETLRFTNINFLSSIPVGLSMVTRSNGIVNIGFVLYASFKNVCERTLPEIFYRYKSLKHYILLPFLMLPLGASIMALMLTIIISIVPFLLVQTYNYFKFCLPHDHNLPDFLIIDDKVLPGQADSVWCNSTFPIAYSYIQSHYWNVGFFKYYEWKQIPNFLLASPIIFILLFHGLLYFKHNMTHCLRLGLRNNILVSSNVSYSATKQRTSWKNMLLYEPNMFVYVVHAVGLTLFCVMFVHIQVSTRLLASASPMLYWICAGVMNISPTPSTDQNAINEHFRRIGMGKRIPSHHLSIANLEGIDNMYSKWRTFVISQHMPDSHSRFLQYYFLSYFIIGVICFSNFLPWT